MVNMGVGQKHIVDGGSGNGNFLIFVSIPSLFHAAVQQDAFAAGFDIMAAAGDFMVSA